MLVNRALEDNSDINIIITKSFFYHCNDLKDCSLHKYDTTPESLIDEQKQSAEIFI